MKVHIETTTTAALKSEVEINQHLIQAGDCLAYIDDANYEKWEVTELFDGGCEAKNGHETKDFYFHQLQMGWSITERTKRQRQAESRAQYATFEEAGCECAARSDNECTCSYWKR